MGTLRRRREQNGVLWLWVPAFAGTTVVSGMQLPQQHRIRAVDGFRAVRHGFLQRRRLHRDVFGEEPNHVVEFPHSLELRVTPGQIDDVDFKSGVFLSLKLLKTEIEFLP